ncbi:hypothetical protein ACEWPM_016790, partial [Roseovarius sp. S4756]|uniref:hypothetical protein n=1 Tax=Roseovarius maritimus TaxID=3342637 RepID=UPI003B6845EA
KTCKSSSQWIVTARVDLATAYAGCLRCTDVRFGPYSVEKLCHAKIGARIWNIALIIGPLANHVS